MGVGPSIASTTTTFYGGGSVHVLSLSTFIPCQVYKTKLEQIQQCGHMTEFLGELDQAGLDANSYWTGD